MMRSRILLSFLLAMPAFATHAGDAGYVPKSIDLLDRPAVDAKAVARLAKRQPVEIIGRDGSWASIKAASKNGWIRLIDVRLDAAPLSPAIAATRVKSPTDSGIRGFSEEELLVGAPNQAESARLKRMGVSVRDAANFARAANLQPRQQDYIEMRDYMPEGGFPEGFFDE